MTFLQKLCFALTLLISVHANVLPVGKSNEDLEKRNEEKSLQEEIFQELNQLSARKQREIFDGLEKQLDVTQKSFVLAEPDHLSPLNLDELKTIRKTIKATDSSSLPPIRNKRTLNFLLSIVARAMGYTLTPNNPDAEWLPRQRPRPPSPPPCTPSPPPCSPSPPPCTPASTPSPSPPCAAPTTAPPCRRGSLTDAQPPTVPSNQIDANTVSYPYRPARTIPLLNFAPLPQGIMVPYPPLFQAQRANPAQPPCGATPAPTTPPPCGTTPAPRPPPCATTPAPAPPPCATTPAPRPPPCATTPAPTPPPCATTPAPRPPPCVTTPAPRPPACATTPAPQPPPCASTPAPTPPPCATTPAPRPPPCGSTPAPPAPPPCATSPPPPPPPPPKPANTPKTSLLLEYDDPVRIQIFSNDKKFLPASGNLYGGHHDVHEENLHSYFFPARGNFKKKDEDVEDEEIQEEHVEEEEEEEEEPTRKQPGNDNLRTYEEEDEQALERNEEEEEESETSLKLVKKPTEANKQRRRMLPPKEDEKTPKMKKPKRKKWVRIVKKQRRKTSTGSSPQENSEISDTEGSRRRLHRRVRERPFDFGDSEESAEDTKRVHLKKVIIHDKDIASREPSAYNLDINPYGTETEADRRKRLEHAVEKYVEDYVEKQLSAELIKNSGVPKTTVFEFTPKNGPKIQTITTTVAKATHGGKPPARQEPRPTPVPRKDSRILQKTSFEESVLRRGDASYEAFTS